MSDSLPMNPRPAEWVLADCPACLKTMKLRRELVGKHALLCPSCRAPIAIEFAAEDSPPVEPTPPPPVTPPPVGLPDQGRSSHLPPSRRISFESAPSGRPLRQTPEQPPAPAPASGGSWLPPARTAPKFADANPDSSGEKRVLPPSASRLDDEFVGKLRAIEADPITRQKKRRRREADEVRIADWDTLELTEIPEAELRADEWDAPGPDLLHPETMIPRILRATAEPVEVVASEAGLLMVERKRTRKGKRKVSSLQEFTRRLTGSVRWILLGLLVCILAAGGYFLAHTFPGRAQVSASEPDPWKASAAGTAADKTAEWTKTDLDSAYEVVRKFLLADGWQAKSAFVRRQEKVKPLMEQWYITHPSGPLSCEEPEDIKKAVLGNTYYVFLSMRIGPERVQRFYTVEHIPPAGPNTTSRYLIDWETSVGYQPMELRDYMVKQPQEPLTFRVLCSPDAYYNYGFSDQEKWLCYKLTYPGDPDFQLNGYVEKGTALADRLGQQLLLEANIMLQLRYPADPISREQVIIDKIVHPSWFYDRDEVVPLGRAAQASPHPTQTP